MSRVRAALPLPGPPVATDKGNQGGLAALARGGIFPNDAAIVCLVGELLIEQSEEWHVTGYYRRQESGEVMTPESKLMIRGGQAIKH